MNKQEQRSDPLGKHENLTIAVIGAGAIGSVVAAYLHKAGHEVVLVGRDDQVETITKKGLVVRGVRGTEVFPVTIVPRLNREYDLAIFTVKTQDLDAAVNQNLAYLNRSLILSSQNGVQADHVLKKYFLEQQMFSSIVMFGATYTRPGEVTFNFEGDWILGKPFGPVDEPLERIANVLKTAFPVVVGDDILGMKWLKVFINFNNCIPALIGKSMQETFVDLDLCRLSILLLKEGVGIIQRAGIELVSLPHFPSERILGLAHMPVDQAAGIIHKTLTALSQEPLYGSILQSILRKRTSEIDYINGEILGLARKIGAQAPMNARVVSMVHQVENSKRYFTLDEVKQIFR